MTKAVKRIPIKKVHSERKQIHKVNEVSPLSTVLLVLVTLSLIGVAGYFAFPNTWNSITGNVMGLFKDKGPVAATVNGQKIYVSEVEDQYNKIPINFRAGLTKEIILDQIISQEVLVQEAKKEGIKVYKKEINAYVQKAIDQSGWDEVKFEQVLEAQGMTLSDLKKLYGVSLVIEKLLNKSVLDKIDISDEDIEQYYNDNHDLYKFNSDARKAEHILIRVGDGYHTDAEALELINDALSRIRDDGEDFNEVAVDVSEDPSVKTNKGDLGYFGPGAMVPEFDDVVFSMTDIGSISDPVKTDFGYHIIKLLDIAKEGEYMSLDNVKDQIKQLLLTEAKRDAVEAYITNLRNEATIVMMTNVTEQVNETPVMEVEEVATEGTEVSVSQVENETSSEATA